jgi:hypothetical protein
MSEEKFTKGEWINEGYSSGHKFIANEDGDEIALVYIPIHDHGTAPTKAEGEANANLIAAAPELFRACEKALKLRSLENSILTSEKLSVTERNGLRREASEIEDELRAVLAKVKGEK